MRGIPILAAALMAVPVPALADDHVSPEEQAVADAATAFMGAISSDDKTELANHMIPEAMIFIHNQMDPDNPRVDIVPVAAHLDRWATRRAKTAEFMNYGPILIAGDMAQVWGPYSFELEGKTTHCGINSLSMVRTAEGWKVGNTSFTMVPPSQCMAVGADWVDGDDS